MHWASFLFQPTNLSLVALLISDPASMHRWGEEFGKQLRAGDLIVLTGPLGAGKTALVQGIGKALGIHDITSPTFVISRVHHAVIPLVHVDAYRLLDNPMALFDDLDLDTLLDTSIVCIEWGSEVVERLSHDYLELGLEFGAGETERTITPTAHGQRWSEFQL